LLVLGKEAIIANQIPQTAAIKRSEAQLQPVFDGSPRFEAIEGTALRYAVNSPTPVIQVGSQTYYAVENGVWFTASTPDGPWMVAVSIPPVIYTIPASSPIYFITSAYVYGSTADVVYVGYTPGYFGTCICPEGVVVYGTGWLFQPWIGTSWFGRPWTYGWGTSFAWTPGGWGFGFAAAHGRPWWGPIGWHAGWGRTRWREGWEAGWGGRYASAHINHLNFANLNIYNRWDEKVHVRNYGGGIVASQGLNNVLAGPDGNVFRRDPRDTWEQHTSQGWRAYDKNLLSPAQHLQFENNLNRLNNEWAARSRGQTYTNQFRSTTGYYIPPQTPGSHGTLPGTGIRPVQPPLGPGGFHLAPGSFRTYGGYRPGFGGSHGMPPRHRKARRREQAAPGDFLGLQPRGTQTMRSEPMVSQQETGKPPQIVGNLRSDNMLCGATKRLSGKVVYPYNLEVARSYVAKAR